MYDPGPSDDELKALGVEREDVTDTSTFDVWPENWPAYAVFCDVSTQWRMGPGGPSGLDYGAVEWVMGLRQVKQAKKLQMLHDIRTLESSALKAMRPD